jgi:predicted nuclease of restriction endonuclease-like (RecB) superfamily
MIVKRNELTINSNNGLQPAINRIKTILESARTHLAREVNSVMLNTYWEIGHIVVEQEQNGELKAKYGKRLLLELSKRLTKDLGRGFSKSNLYNMREFYTQYPIFQMTSGKLSWSHYVELLAVSDKNARSFYEQECLNARWSVKELNRQISTSLFERLLLSKGTTNQKQVLEMAQQGISMDNPQSILKQPFVFEFLGAREEKPLLEKDLETKLIRHLEFFLLELGRGFMFVGSQQRVTIGNTHYYVDMVFYNKILKAYVLIDLKMGELQLEHAGQMNGYLNYYQTEVNDEDDNPPIGIILCSSKRDVVAEYALGGLNNQIFASNYTYYIPTKEELINEVKTLLEREKNNTENENGE